MNKLKRFLEKIKEFFNKILGKENHLLLEESKDSINIKENEEQDGKDTIIDKKEFFNLYKNIKSGDTSLENLMLEDLIKVLMMSQEELKIEDKRIEDLESEIYNLNTEKVILSNKK